MSSDHLDLVLPDWCGLDTVRRSPLPFALWTIGDQCLLHHWLDHAVNQGVSTVHVFAADRPAAVRQMLAESLGAKGGLRQCPVAPNVAQYPPQWAQWPCRRQAAR